jgi:multidrug resistance efflux pump
VQPAELSDASNGNAQGTSRSPAAGPAADLANTDMSDESAADRDSAIKLGALTEELDAVRTALEAAQADIRTAQEEAEEAKRSAQPTVPPTNTLSDLEARVAEAERRAEEAEQTLEEVALSPEASSLRERLARTAARKKLGSDDPRAS